MSSGLSGCAAATQHLAIARVVVTGHWCPAAETVSRPTRAPALSSLIGFGRLGGWLIGRRFAKKTNPGTSDKDEPEKSSSGTADGGTWAQGRRTAALGLGDGVAGA
jgi:hypothetical protein